MTITDLLDLGSKITVVTMFIIIVYGGAKGWWVFGWYYQEKLDHCDRLQEQIDRLTGISERTIDLAEPVIRGQRGGSRRP
jgi:hypothetical protein